MEEGGSGQAGSGPFAGRRLEGCVPSHGMECQFLVQVCSILEGLGGRGVFGHRSWVRVRRADGETRHRHISVHLRLRFRSAGFNCSAVHYCVVWLPM